jgi:NTE family protein
MKAYAVFDGGGVKGAALAGALAASEDKKVKFEGYGGTSAGSIVALLASIGYTGEEIRDRLKTDVHPIKMLDDDGTLYRVAHGAMQRGSEIVKKSGAGWRELQALCFLVRNRKLLRRLGGDLGLYSGDKLCKVLLDLIVQKKRGLIGIDDPTFEDLEREGGKPLKIVASDTRARRAIVFSKSASSPSQSVIQAVRASVSYPFFFQPVMTRGGKRLVDGGLSSNLPVFLFDSEHEQSQWPIIAFDLVAGERTGAPGVMSFIDELSETVFEASDEIMGSLLPGLKHIRLQVPANIKTLQFDLSDTDIESLYKYGYSDASAALNRWDKLIGSAEAGERIQKQLAVYYGPEALFKPVLEALKREMESKTLAKNVRTHIMLPTGRSDASRIVVYQAGFRKEDSDSALELDEFAGCSGQAYRDHAPAFADLVQARSCYDSNWGMTTHQQSMVASDRSAMLSVPVFARELRRGESEKDVPVRAILSIDTSSTLEEAGWIENRENAMPVVTRRVTDLAIQWAAVISKLLS